MIRRLLPLLLAASAADLATFLATVALHPELTGAELGPIGAAYLTGGPLAAIAWKSGGLAVLLAALAIARRQHASSAGILLAAAFVLAVTGAAFNLSALASVPADAGTPSTWSALPQDVFHPVPPSAAQPIPAASPSIASGTVGRLVGAPDSVSAPTDPETGAPPSPAAAPKRSAPATLTASWYDDGPGLYAATAEWHWGQPTYRLRLSALGRSVVVTVRDHCPSCAATGRIDVSPAAFAALGVPPSAGLVRVEVRREPQ